MKKYIDRNKLKNTLTKYIVNKSKKSEDELFSKTLVELINCVLFTLSITSNHPLFEELKQDALIKLYKEIVINERLDLNRTPLELWSYLWLVVQRPILAELKKYKKYTVRVKTGTDKYYQEAEGRYSEDDDNWDMIDNNNKLRTMQNKTINTIITKSRTVS